MSIECRRQPTGALRSASALQLAKLLEEKKADFYMESVYPTYLVNLVLSKKVAAGALSNDDYGTIDEKRRSDIIILGETDMFPRHLVSTRKDLEPAVKNRLKDILLSMHQDEEGPKILKQIDNRTKFDLLPGGEEMMRRKLVELFRPRKTN